MNTIPLKLDGYTDLPPGKIANVVTYFEMKPPAPPPEPVRRDGLTFRRIAEPRPDWFRDLFLRIGEDWLWTGLIGVANDELGDRLSTAGIEIYALERNNMQIGLVELDRRIEGDAQIVVFGLVPQAIGTGSARFLMDETLRHAFTPTTHRVWLHTCTFDHPGAGRFYQRAGFKAYKYAIEVLDDPRLGGDFPATAAPHVPVIQPEDT